MPGMIRRYLACFLFSAGPMGSAALADDRPLPVLAEEEGFSAVLEEVNALAAVAKSPKKLGKELAARGFAELRMDVSLVAGAELSLSEPSALTGCTYDGGIACTWAAKAPASASADGYQAACRTRYGAGMNLDMAASPAADGQLGWTVSGLQACWDLGGVGIRVSPRANTELEGVGMGDDFHAPELVQLSQDEVEGIIQSHDNAFRYCFRQHAAAGSSGKLVIEYKIGEDGSVSSTKFKSNTLQDSAVEACIVERFGRMKFPKPMGGFEGGEWPVTFLKPK